MDAVPDLIDDLWDLYQRGETLIIEYVGFRKSGRHWLRDEVHNVVGYASEHSSTRCVGPDDISPMKGPPSDEDAARCPLCARRRVHTRALHAEALRLELKFGGAKKAF